MTHRPTARQILHEVFGYPEFRGRQEDVINTLAGGGSLTVLMPTGGGKSLCYQIPALMREGVAVVVSPLIALMNDQVASLHVAGIEAAAVNSGTSADEAREIADKLAQGRLKLLYVAPERLLPTAFYVFSTNKPSACSPLTKRTASAGGDTISAPNINSSVCLPNAIRTSRASP